jgi:hypothetical protein
MASRVTATGVKNDLRFVASIHIPMTDNRYTRWQGLGINQLSVAVALISGLSVAGLGAGLSLIQNDKFMPSAFFKCVFAVSLLLLLLAAFFSTSAIITRLLDFRLTARKIRKNERPDYDKPLTIFWLGPNAYGRATWGFFWSACISCMFGVLLLTLSIGTTYLDRLH